MKHQRGRREARCHCQLCGRAQEIAGLRRQRRELSLASVYRKDYHSGHEEGREYRVLPQSSARKNESSNFTGRSKSFLEINSTYLANYLPAPHARPLPPSPRGPPAREPDVLDSYLSTYSDAHRRLPVLAQESYRIADPQACSPALPFPRVTEYSKNYRLGAGGREAQLPRRDHSFEDGVSLFETTQRAAYLGRRAEQERARGPADCMATLPTSSFLYTTTYQQEYLLRRPVPDPDPDSRLCSDRHRF